LRHFCLSLSLFAGGCSVTPPPAPPLACAATRFPEDPRIDAWSVDKFAGRYRSGAQLLDVARQDEHGLVVRRAGYGTRDLATDNVESWKFHDGCGVTYTFVLPPDGPGGMLTIHEPDGRVSEWTRD
jgi:hypothetical protein